MHHTYGGQFCTLLDFEDQASAMQWQHDTTSIKSLIADINEDYSKGLTSQLERKTRLHNLWIPLTEEFVSEWGKHMVPLDIRRAIADVRRNIDMDAVDWPAILYLDDAVGEDVIVPAHVDEFGVFIVVDGNPPDGS